MWAIECTEALIGLAFFGRSFDRLEFEFKLLGILLYEKPVVSIF